MFKVEYLEHVLDDLAAAWLLADSSVRGRITAAAHTIDALLQRNPHNLGESRPGGRRILFELPLCALFRIEPDGRTVTVVDMWVV